MFYPVKVWPEEGGETGDRRLERGGGRERAEGRRPRGRGKRRRQRQRRIRLGTVEGRIVAEWLCSPG